MPSSNPTHTMRLVDWSLLKADLDWIYEGQVEARFRETREQYAGQSVYLLRRGTALIRNAAGTVRAQAGDWLLPIAGNRYQSFSSDAEILSIHLQLHWPGQEPLFKWKTAMTFPSVRFPQLEVRSRRLLHYARRVFPGASSYLPLQYSSLAIYTRLRSYFSFWFCTFIDTLLALDAQPTRLGSIDPRILEAALLLDRMPLNARFKEEEFAHQVKLSPTHLDRLFVSQFGLTPRRYLERRKLEQACARLQQSHASGSIKEISFDLGFNSLPHFSGWFRQKAGLSPRQFQLRKSETFQPQSPAKNAQKSSIL